MTLFCLENPEIFSSTSPLQKANSRRFSKKDSKNDTPLHKKDKNLPAIKVFASENRKDAEAKEEFDKEEAFEDPRLLSANFIKKGPLFHMQKAVSSIERRLTDLLNEDSDRSLEEKSPQSQNPHERNNKNKPSKISKVSQFEPEKHKEINIVENFTAPPQKNNFFEFEIKESNEKKKPTPEPRKSLKEEEKKIERNNIPKPPSTSKGTNFKDIAIEKNTIQPQQQAKPISENKKNMSEDKSQSPEKSFEVKTGGSNELSFNSIEKSIEKSIDKSIERNREKNKEKVVAESISDKKTEKNPKIASIDKKNSIDKPFAKNNNKAPLEETENLKTSNDKKKGIQKQNYIENKDSSPSIELKPNEESSPIEIETKKIEKKALPVSKPKNMTSSSKFEEKKEDKNKIIEINLKEQQTNNKDDKAKIQETVTNTQKVHKRIPSNKYENSQKEENTENIEDSSEKNEEDIKNTKNPVKDNNLNKALSSEKQNTIAKQVISPQQRETKEKDLMKSSQQAKIPLKVAQTPQKQENIDTKSLGQSTSSKKILPNETFITPVKKVELDKKVSLEGSSMFTPLTQNSGGLRQKDKEKEAQSNLKQSGKSSVNKKGKQEPENEIDDTNDAKSNEIDISVKSNEKSTKTNVKQSKEDLTKSLVIEANQKPKDRKYTNTPAKTEEPQKYDPKSMTLNEKNEKDLSTQNKPSKIEKPNLSGKKEISETPKNNDKIETPHGKEINKPSPLEKTREKKIVVTVVQPEEIKKLSSSKSITFDKEKDKKLTAQKSENEIDEGNLSQRGKKGPPVKKSEESVAIDKKIEKKQQKVGEVTSPSEKEIDNNNQRGKKALPARKSEDITRKFEKEELPTENTQEKTKEVKPLKKPSIKPPETKKKSLEFSDKPEEDKEEETQKALTSRGTNEKSKESNTHSASLRTEEEEPKEPAFSENDNNVVHTLTKKQSDYPLKKPSKEIQITKPNEGSKKPYFTLPRTYEDPKSTKSVIESSSKKVIEKVIENPKKPIDNAIKTKNTDISVKNTDSLPKKLTESKTLKEEKTTVKDEKPQKTSSITKKRLEDEKPQKTSIEELEERKTFDSIKEKISPISSQKNLDKTNEKNQSSNINDSTTSSIVSGKKSNLKSNISNEKGLKNKATIHRVEIAKQEENEEEERKPKKFWNLKSLKLNQEEMELRNRLSSPTPYNRKSNHFSVSVDQKVDFYQNKVMVIFYFRCLP